MWSQTDMTRRLNWERLSWERKPKLTLGEDKEFMDSELATAWLRSHEKWLTDRAKLRSWQKSPTK
jgi:hypothetical protein